VVFSRAGRDGSIPEWERLMVRWSPTTAAAALAIGLTMQLNAAAAQAPAVAPAPGVEVIDMAQERYQRLTVPVSIQGEGPFRFMVDTGAQATVLSRALADRLSLHDRETALLVGMVSSRIVETTKIDAMTLGSRSFYVRQAPLVEAEHIGGADGILGLDSLQDQRVLLDFVRREMAVDSAAALGGNRGFEIVVKARERLGQLIITSARLDGIKVDVVIDTGSQGTTGNLALLDKLRGRNRVLGDIEMTDIHGTTMSGPVRIANQLEIERVRLQHFPILFADSAPFRTLGLIDRPAMILGMEELRHFRRVAIDFRTQRVLFDVPAAAEVDRLFNTGI
jgi:predicted aspartyl protease